VTSLYRHRLGAVARQIDRVASKVRSLADESGRADPIDAPPEAAPPPAAPPPPARPPSRGGASVWFWDHYDVAAGEVIDFLGGDGIDLRGKRVADIGCGDGILDAGLAAKADPECLVGLDVNLTDEVFLAKELEAEGAPPMHPSLSFRRSDPTRLPADDGEFDVVVTWSAFEHIRDPIPVLREIRRVLRPHGVLMLQLWPFYFSQHGSHLMEWFPEGFAHLLRPHDRVADDIRGRGTGDRQWIDYMLAEFGTLNRITVDELQQSILAAGFWIPKFELLSNPVHLRPELGRYPLSELGITGVKLLAAPRS
jgi:ubiquinone/menaquinone biosynthesis C-methylase UbiE